jgi:acyl carrier protein phosphodiesterase
VKHITDAELNRRIAANLEERTATHEAMIDPATGRARTSPLGEDWADLSRRYSALADQSGALYAELLRREVETANA